MLGFYFEVMNTIRTNCWYGPLSLVRKSYFQWTVNRQLQDEGYRTLDFDEQKEIKTNVSNPDALKHLYNVSVSLLFNPCALFYPIRKSPEVEPTETLSIRTHLDEVYVYICDVNVCTLKKTFWFAVLFCLLFTIKSFGVGTVEM